MPLAATWVDLALIILSEISQRKIITCITYMCVLFICLCWVSAVAHGIRDL